MVRINDTTAQNVRQAALAVLIQFLRFRDLIYANRLRRFA